MSLKKERASTSERLKNERVQCEENFEAQIEQASKIADPTERVLQLEKTRHAASNAGRKERSKIVLAASEVYHWGGKELAIYFGLAIPTVGIGSLTYLVKNSKHEKSFKEQLEKEAEDYIKNMSDKETHLAEMIDALIEEHVQEIAQSPKCEDVLNQPGLVKKFAAASIKKGIPLPEEKEEPMPQQPRTRLLLKTGPSAG